jgi:hypothetical protein
MRLWITGLAAALLSFVVSTQIEFVHRLDRAGLAISFLAVWLLLMAVDLFLFRRRFSLTARITGMFLLFLIVWALNTVSSLTHCDAGHINCHRVFGG